MAEGDGIEAQELCVQALRSVRNCTDSDLFLTLTELEALTAQLDEETDLIGPDAAFQLLCISLEAIKTARMAVAVSAFRVLKNGIRDGNIESTLFKDDNMAVLSAVLDACISTCWMFEDMMTASALDLLAKIFLRMLQVNPSRFLVLLGESVQGLASAMLKISLLCVGRCFCSATGNGNMRVLLTHREKYRSPAVVAALVLSSILDHSTDNTLTLICHLDAELEELVLCMMAHPPYAVLDVYGRILQNALKAASQMHDGIICTARGLAQQDFDFFRRAQEFGGLTEFLLNGPKFDVFGFLKWRAGCSLQPNHDATSPFQVDIMKDEHTELPHVVCDGLELRIIQDALLGSDNAHCIPLFSLISGKVVGPRIALATLALPPDGQDPRALTESKETLFIENEILIKFGSEKEAHRGMSWILERVNLEKMGPFDEDFLERVFDDTRMPVGYQGAQQLLKPSGVLWPNLVETSSRASNATSKHLSRKIFYASTKDQQEILREKAGEHIEREFCFDKRLEGAGGISQVSAAPEFIRKESRSDETLTGLPMSFPLSGSGPSVHYRRVGIATTKKGKECSPPPISVSTSYGAPTQLKLPAAEKWADVSQTSEHTKSPEGDADKEKPIQMSAQHVNYIRSISVSQPVSKQTPCVFGRLEKGPEVRKSASVSHYMTCASTNARPASTQKAAEIPMSNRSQDFPPSIIVSQTTSVIPLLLDETSLASNAPLLDTTEKYNPPSHYTCITKDKTDVVRSKEASVGKRKRTGPVAKEGFLKSKACFVPHGEPTHFSVLDLLNMAVKKVHEEKHECLSGARNRVKTTQSAIIKKLGAILEAQGRERKQLLSSFEAEKRTIISKLSSLERIVEGTKPIDCAAAIPECKLVEIADSECNRAVMELLKTAKQSIRAKVESLNKDTILSKV